MVWERNSPSGSSFEPRAETLKDTLPHEHYYLRYGWVRSRLRKQEGEFCDEDDYSGELQQASD